MNLFLKTTIVSWHWLMLFHPSNACLLSGGLYFAWIFRSSQFCSTKLFLLTGLDCLKDLVEIKRMMIHKMNNFEKEEMVVMWWAKEIDRCYFGCFGRGVALAWLGGVIWDECVECGEWSNNLATTFQKLKQLLLMRLMLHTSLIMIIAHV